MRILKVLSLLAALALLGGAVLDAQTGLVREVLSAAADAGAKKPKLNPDYMHATKAGPLIHFKDEDLGGKDAGK